MTDFKPHVSKHAKIVAILWLVVLLWVWVYEGGVKPFGEATQHFTKANWESGNDLRNIEKRFEEDMGTFDELRPYYNWATFWAFGQSNGLVVRGKGDWMYYRAFFNPPGDTEEKHRDFLNMFKQIEAQFKAKGCDVYWLVVPEKAMIHHYYPAKAAAAAENREKHYLEFMAKAKKMRLNMIELLPAYEAAAQAGTIVFLKDDTHWSPKGMDIAMDTLLEKWKPAPSSDALTWDTRPINRAADLAGILNFPKTLVDKKHRLTFDSTKIRGEGTPELIVFGTSFSYSFDLAQNLGKKVGVRPEDHAFANLVIPDLLVAALDRLDHSADLEPGTAVVFEFPYRLLNRQEELTQVKQQFQWQRILGDQPLQRAFDPKKLELHNLSHGDVWKATNNHPMIVIDQNDLQDLVDANFLRVRLKANFLPKDKVRIKVFYDLGKGFQHNIFKNFYLSKTRSWQTWLIPLKFKNNYPQRIRLDFMNLDRHFELESIDIY